VFANINRITKTLKALKNASTIGQSKKHLKAETAAQKPLFTNSLQKIKQNRKNPPLVWWYHEKMKNEGDNQCKAAQ